MKTTIDKAGRVVIPKKIRDAAGIEPGMELDVRLCDGRVEIEPAAANIDRESALDRKRAQDRLLELVQQLPPLDRQIMLLYLEGIDNVSIAEITGVSATNVSTRVHRIKSTLTREIRKGVKDAC